MHVHWEKSVVNNTRLILRMPRPAHANGELRRVIGDVEFDFNLGLYEWGARNPNDADPLTAIRGTAKTQREGKRFVVRALKTLFGLKSIRTK